MTFMRALTKHCMTAHPWRNLACISRRRGSYKRNQRVWSTSCADQTHVTATLCRRTRPDVEQTKIMQPAANVPTPSYISPPIFERERGSCNLRRLRADRQISALFSTVFGLGCPCSQSAQGGQPCKAREGLRHEKTQHDAIGTFTRPNSICAQVRLSMQPPHLLLVLLRQILSHDLLAEGADRRDALRRC